MEGREGGREGREGKGSALLLTDGSGVRGMDTPETAMRGRRDH